MAYDMAIYFWIREGNLEQACLGKVFTSFLVFQAGHSLCSKKDIPCVPSRTRLKNREDVSDFDDFLTKTIAAAQIFFRKFSKTFLKYFRLFRPFENFQKMDRDVMIRLVQKSPKSEPSSRFFGRLKILLRLVFSRRYPSTEAFR